MTESHEIGPAPLTPPEVADVLRTIELRAGYIMSGHGAYAEAEEIKRLVAKAFKGLRDWWHGPHAETLSPSQTGTSNPAPHRAVRLKLEIEADTREDLRHAVDHFDRTFDQRVVPGGASGGYSWGWTYTLAEDAGPTHDEYAAALEAWLAKEREASHAGR